jgi:branched-subunit amino acid ABC-type transport system permease component
VVLAFQMLLFKSAFVEGIVAGASYGLLAVAMVLTFRMSRVVGFVHGGIATVGLAIFWWLTADPGTVSGRGTGGSAWATHHWPQRWPAVLIAIALGALLGALFGSVVTGRMATWPRTTVTTFSLGAMLIAAGAAGSIWKGAFELVPPAFGSDHVKILGYVVTWHDITTVAILVALVVAGHFVLTRTRRGVQIRAIADDIEAAEMVGVPVRGTATGVWCAAGALAALSGVLVGPSTRFGDTVILFVLLRALAAAVLGGFDSLPLALGGAFIFGQVESHLIGGTFWTVSSGWREVILMAVLFSGVLLLARRGVSHFKVGEA